MRYDGVACREAAAIRVQQHRSSSSEKRREHQREVHQQWVRLIQQQESDDCRSQSLGLPEQSTEQCNATRFL